MKKRTLLSLLLLLSIIAACAPVTSPSSPAGAASPVAPAVVSQPTEPAAADPMTLPDTVASPAGAVSATAPAVDRQALVQPGDLEYLGAFRLPGESGGSSWDYSGRGLTYYPGGDPNGTQDGFPGSLFGVGNDQQQYVSEISIPAPVLSRNLDDLNTAETLQPFADITAGMFGETDLPRLGLQYLPALNGQATGKLYFVHGQHFQDFEPSHGWSELTLADPQPAGPWIFDGYTNYVTSDYLFEIPESWASYIPGAPRLATGRFREGVWSGGGPALIAYTLPESESPLPPRGSLQQVAPLLLYGVQEATLTDIISDESMQMLNYNPDDAWWGGAWLTSEERAAVIFVGTKASGKSWYGFANGVVWEYDCAEQTPPTCPEVPEWPYQDRGYWAEGYQPQIMFYDPVDLVTVANGQLQTWEPQPYAALDLAESFFNPEIDLANYKFELAGAVAYDREHGLLFIIERLADGYKSVIHVWRIK